MTPTSHTGAVICPLCQTEAPRAIREVLAGGGHWYCPRCQQNWSARRLQTVAAYTEWCTIRDAGDRRRARHGLLPASEVDSVGERRQHHELGEGEPGSFGHVQTPDSPASS